MSSQLQIAEMEIQEAKSQAAKLPQVAAKLYVAEQRIKALENSQAGLLERGIALEQLCRDMYDCYIVGQYKECYECEYFSKAASHCDFPNRMEALGLIEGSE